MSFKYTARNLDGILLLDKPVGISSNEALQRVKRLLRAKKAGHGGSLDPIASGLLPIFLGNATKLVQFMLEANKHYIVTAKLGVRTNTGDSEGQIIASRPIRHYTEIELETVLQTLRGSILQVPPMFSALKHKGQPLYKLARQGIEIERLPRPISVYELRVKDYQEDRLSLEVKASKGTYVRTLVEDIGEGLGCGAHVVTLRRVGVGPYADTQMISLPELESLFEQGEAQLDACLLPMESAIATWPALKLSEAAVFYIMHGQAVMLPDAPTQGWVKLLSNNNRFLGVGEILEDGRVSPKRLFRIDSACLAS